MGMEKFTFNLEASKLRKDTLDGKEYLVAPMAMLTEGVHTGSNGPLLYTKDELSKTPVVWNMKPLVIYHPSRNGEGISACQPEVIASRGVGIVMHAKYDDKLRAEAWFDESKLKKVDDRVLNSLNEGKMVEISTGLFTDNIQEVGEYNGKQYVARATNYRPDHLAILPDQRGACSIADGAGLLQTNEAKEFIDTNKLTEEEKETWLTYNRDWPQAKRDKLDKRSFAGPHESFPIESQKDVKAAASLAHHAKDPAAVKARIKKIAKAKGLKPPKAWGKSTVINDGGTGSGTEQSDKAKRKIISQELQGRVKTVHGRRMMGGDWDAGVEDIYSDFFVYTLGGKHYYQNYDISPQNSTGSVQSDRVNWKGKPKQVKKSYSWKDLSGTFVADISGADKHVGPSKPAKPSTNASLDAVRTAVSDKLREKEKKTNKKSKMAGCYDSGTWVNDVFDNGTFVYSEDGKYFAQKFKKIMQDGNDPEVEFVGKPTEVKKHVEWRDKEGTVLANAGLDERPGLGEVRNNLIKELVANGFDTQAEIAMLRKQPIDSLVLLVQGTHAQAVFNLGGVGSAGGTGTGASGVGAGGNTGMSYGSKQFALRKPKKSILNPEKKALQKSGKRSPTQKKKMAASGVGAFAL